MHQGILAIEGCGNPSHIQSVMENDGENNQKVRKDGQVVNQTFTPRPKHDKI